MSLVPDRRAGEDGSQSPGADAAPPGDSSRAAGRWQLSLAIAIPAMLVLFVIAYGMIAMQSIENEEHVLTALGRTDVAGRITLAHIYTMVFLSGAAIVMGAGLAFAILRPIRVLTRTLQSVARGNLDERAPRLAASPELGDLSRSFNSMIDFVNQSIQERNRYILEGLGAGVMILDEHGRVSALNSNGQRILGLDSAAVMARRPEELRDLLPSKYRPFWEHLCGGIPSGQVTVEVPLLAGRERASLFVTTSPLRRQGEGRGALINFRDAEEIRALTAQLSRTDQLAALGTFTMGLVHELRNPLGSIKGIVQLLKMQQSLPPDASLYLDRVVGEVNRLDRFIGELLDFSGPSVSPPSPCYLTQILHRAYALALGQSEALKEKGIKFIEDFEAIPMTMVQADRLAQAFANIVRNAFEAAAPGSEVTLSARRQAQGPDQYVLASVRNTGSTIPPEARAKIFDPFFTTKEKGTGLGLAIAHQIVTQQGGTLNLAVGENEVTFVAKFKAIPDSSAVAAEGAAA